MNIRKISFWIVVLIGLSSSFSAFAAEIPVGTLLYRTSPGGLMFGQNTNWLLSPFGVSWLNAGHVGIYIGDNQVVEAAEGKIQIIPLSHFVNLKVGEKFVGARIPKDFNEKLKNFLYNITTGQVGESYDSTFHVQKGQNSGEWTCVGFTEKMYESLNSDSADNLTYDQSKYYIDLVSDGHDVPENYTKSSCFTIPKDSLASPQKWEDGSPNCFSKTKEFSFLNEASISLASKIIGGKDDKGRSPYIFFPYTQFLSDKLKDVPIDPSLVSSYFDRPSEIGLMNKIKTMATNFALRTAGVAIKTENKTRNVVVLVSNTLNNFFANLFNNDGLKLASVFDSTQNQNQQDQATQKNTNISSQDNNGDQITGEALVAEENATTTFNNDQENSTSTTKELEKKDIDKEKSAPITFCSFDTSQVPSRQGLIINEVAWMGTKNSASDEWIELKNISNSSINLFGWQLINQDNGIEIDLGLINRSIAPGGFVLLERTDDSSVPNIKADLIYTGGLSNSDEGLRLFNSQCNLVDEVSANPDWSAGSKSSKLTMERSSNLSWYTSNIVGGTPKRENSLVATTPVINETNNNIISPKPSVAPIIIQNSKILINEIQLESNSGAKDEFVELYNLSNQDFDLTGWYLQKETQSGTSSISTYASKDLFEKKTIGGNGYLLIANASSTSFASLADILAKSIYGISKNNTLILKAANGDIIDKVGWGEASDCEGSFCAIEPPTGQSIQRKISDNVFIDTDNNSNDFEVQSCPSPKAQSGTCQTSQSNQAPSAFFVYASASPKVGGLITFNASSSTDPDGVVASYSWDFGDNSTSSVSIATTTHSFLATGDYMVKLVVFDNQNASSTVTSTIAVQSSESLTFPLEQFVLISDRYSDFPYSFGTKNINCLECPNTAALQSIIPTVNFKLNEVAVKVYRPQIGSFHYFGNLRLSVLGDTNNSPDFNNKLGEAFIPDVDTLDGNSESIFDFNPSVALAKDVKYWLMLDVAGYSDAPYQNSPQGGYFTSDWRVVINSRDNAYPFGAFGMGHSGSCVSMYCRFNIPYSDGNADWYFRVIGESESVIPKQPPRIPGDLSFDFNQNASSSQLTVNWRPAVDIDTHPESLTYQINFSSRGAFNDQNWIDIGTSTSYQKTVAYGDDFLISVRALDDSDNFSETKTLIWSYPHFFIEQLSANGWTPKFPYYIGSKNMNNCPSCPGTASLQSFTPAGDLIINRAVLKIQRTTGGYSGNLVLAIYPDNGNNFPDFNNQLGQTVSADGSVVSLNADKDVDTASESIFNFSNLINLNASTKYWMVFGISYDDNRGNGENNDWKVAVNSSDNVYSEGVNGRGHTGTCSGFCDFEIPYPDANTDWYFRIGRE